MYLGKNLAILRRHWSESQEAFGERFGTGRSVVYRWENNETEPPLSAMVMLEELTGVSIIKWVTTNINPEDLPSYPIVSGGKEDLLKEPDYAKVLKNGDSETLEALKSLRLALEAERESAAAERAENAKFRKEFDFLKKKVELLDTEVMRTAGKKK
jgi:transcriptional regulator with XRE-family HTH domain